MENYTATGFYGKAIKAINSRRCCKTLLFQLFSTRLSKASFARDIQWEQTAYEVEDIKTTFKVQPDLKGRLNASLQYSRFSTGIINSNFLFSENMKRGYSCLQVNLYSLHECSVLGGTAAAAAGKGL